MFTLNEITNENNDNHNNKWPYILHHPYRMLIIGRLWVRKNKCITQFNKRTR